MKTVASFAALMGVAAANQGYGSGSMNWNSTTLAAPTTKPFPTTTGAEPTCTVVVPSFTTVRSFDLLNEQPLTTIGVPISNHNHGPMRIWPSLHLHRQLFHDLDRHQVPWRMPRDYPSREPDSKCYCHCHCYLVHHGVSFDPLMIRLGKISNICLLQLPPANHCYLQHQDIHRHRGTRANAKTFLTFVAFADQFPLQATTLTVTDAGDCTVTTPVSKLPPPTSYPQKPTWTYEKPSTTPMTSPKPSIYSPVWNATTTYTTETVSSYTTYCKQNPTSRSGRD